MCVYPSEIFIIIKGTYNSKLFELMDPTIKFYFEKVKFDIKSPKSIWN